MYAVIFKAKVAKIATIDQKYADMAARLRQRAIEKYGCLSFESVTEGKNEMAISYWPDKESILRWKHDELHVEAQGLGKSRWYHSYQVDIVKVEGSYQHNPEN